MLSPEELTQGLKAVHRQQQQQSDDVEVCEALKAGKCPHRISGRTLVNGVLCSEVHPNRCRKFTRFGTNAKQGCLLGSECKYYHPQHCKSSVKNKQCFNDKCTLTHLVGTKRSRQNANPKSNRDNANLPEHKKTARNRTKSGSEITKSSSDNAGKLSKGVEILARTSYLSSLQNKQSCSTNGPTGIMSDDAESINQPPNAKSPKSTKDNPMELYSSVISLNMQSFNPSARSQSNWKLPHFRKIIQREVKSHEVPFIALTETWLKSYIHDSQIELEHYNVHRCDRSTRVGGGVLLYTHESIPITEVEKLDNQTCQMLICKCEISRMIICVLYRPPEAPLTSFKPCLEAISSYISGNDNYDMCLLGDFNFPCIDWNTISIIPGATSITIQCIWKPSSVLWLKTC